MKILVCADGLAHSKKAPTQAALIGDSKVSTR